MNELMIVKNIEKRLQIPQEVKVFPLTPTHRKELRQLRDKNIGELRQRLNIIKELKKEEYIKKYKKDIQKELKNYQEVSKALNDDWKKIVDKIKLWIETRKKQEDKIKDSIKKLSLNYDYGDIPQLDVSGKTWKREFSTDMVKLTKNIANQEFESKFGVAFQKSQEHIDQLYTMYEEAINFGDLEIVKEIYYKLKKSDDFFNKVSGLTI